MNANDLFDYLTFKQNINNIVTVKDIYDGLRRLKPLIFDDTCFFAVIGAIKLVIFDDDLNKVYSQDVEFDSLELYQNENKLYFKNEDKEICMIDLKTIKSNPVSIIAPDQDEIRSKLEEVDLEKNLKKKVFGQDEALQVLLDALYISKAGLKDPRKPVGCYLFTGPTGCGKTEISRRLAKLADAPFIKVEATKFTEVGYVGRDVEQIIRDLIEVAINLEKKKIRDRFIDEAKLNAEETVLKALLGDNPSEETKEKFRGMLRDNKLNDKEVEIAIDQKSNPFQSLDIPGMPGAQMGMINMNDIFGKGLKNKKKTKLKIGEAYEPLIQEEIEKIAEKQNVVQNAIKSVQESGIVFIDEIDKIAPNSERRGGDVSREGVQRDLLPLIEGTVVSTKYGTVETNHILFIASGAFHQSKPSDLLPELQGRLPVRVRLNALKKDDFVRILKDTDNSLTKQYKSLFETENIELEFDDEAIDEIANLTEQINKEVENIGARRLQTMFEKILEKLSFEANLSEKRTEIVSKQWVSDAIQSEIKPTDEKKFIL